MSERLTAPARTPAARRRPGRKLRGGLALAGALLLAACGGTVRLGGDPQLGIRQGNELPPPDRMDLTAQARPYLIGPFDRMTIDVFGIEELSKREVQVDASGRISFPLVGVIEVAGLTPGEVEGLLNARLQAAYVRNPQATVNLKETVSQVVTIEGQVKKPGLYPVLGRMTLMRAVATAEGTTEYTKLDDVVIFRTVNGQRLAALYDLNAIRHGAYADPEVYANDIVMVGDDKAKRLFKDLLTTFSLVSGPLIITLDRIVR